MSEIGRSESPTKRKRNSIGVTPEIKRQEVSLFLPDIHQKDKPTEGEQVQQSKRKNASEVNKGLDSDYCKPFKDVSKAYKLVIKLLLALIAQCPWDILVAFRTWLREVKMLKDLPPQRKKDTSPYESLKEAAERCTRIKENGREPWKKIAYLQFIQEYLQLKEVDGEAVKKFDTECKQNEEMTKLKDRAFELLSVCQLMTKDSPTSVFLLCMMGITLRDFANDFNADAKRLLCMFFIPSQDYEDEILKVLPHRLAKMLLYYTRNMVKKLELYLGRLSKNGSPNLSVKLKSMLVMPLENSVNFGLRIRMEEDERIFRMIPPEIQFIGVQRKYKAFKNGISYHIKVYDIDNTGDAFTILMDRMDAACQIWNLKIVNLDSIDPGYQDEDLLNLIKDVATTTSLRKQGGHLLPMMILWSGTKLTEGLGDFPASMCNALSEEKIANTKDTDSKSKVPLPQFMRRFSSYLVHVESQMSRSG